MRVIIDTCDRCEREIPSEKSILIVRICDSADKRTPIAKLDICEECFDKIIAPALQLKFKTGTIEGTEETGIETPGITVENSKDF